MTTRRKADQPAAADSLDRAAQDGASGVVSSSPATGASWDPYEVWLTRVKQPRERSARKASGPAGRAVATEIGDSNRPALSPALSR
jgi:hypothetical protein